MKGRSDLPAPTAAVATPPLTAAQAEPMETAALALTLAAWPQDAPRGELPRLAAILSARGPGAVPDISSALATADSDAARGVLADALALIGTDAAIQELCTAAVKVPEAEARSIASAFRTLTRPAAVPMLATLLSEVSDGPLLEEAGDAVARLADAAGVDALTDLSQAPEQLHSQRDAALRILGRLQNPEAIPALEILAADETDPARAAAARQSLQRLKPQGN